MMGVRVAGVLQGLTVVVLSVACTQQDVASDSPRPAAAPTHTVAPEAASLPKAFPNAATTGPAAAGFKDLTPYSGPTVITEPGTVIKGHLITAPLEVAADNVTIQGNHIRTASSIRYDVPAIGLRPGARGVRILDNEISGRGPTATAAPASGVKLYGDDIEFRRNNLHHIAGDGVTMDGDDIAVTDNYLHNFVYRTDHHYDAVVYGGADTDNRVSIAGNRIEMWLPEDMTALVSLPDFAPGMVVQRNLLAGGGYAISGGGGGVSFTDNRFSTKFSPLCGTWGTHAHLAKPGHEAITWKRNTWIDGARAGKEVAL